MHPPAMIALTPSQEEDITQPRPWEYDDPEFGEQRRRSKGKERESSGELVDVERDDLIESPVRSSYPPVADEETEARRVQETLKQWEAAELQRRKAARQSTASTTSPSLVDNVSRRATLLLSSRTRKSGSISNASLGVHAPLPIQDDHTDEVPLTSIPASPTPSPSRSETTITPLDDPFNPPLEPVSPFADPTFTARDSTSTIVLEDQTSALAPQTPRERQSFIGRQPPPALPLNLPRPKTPPPPIDGSPTPPRAKSPDNVQASRPTRWWHEWLCGCGEGSDRGGDHQAGKTNPFE